MGRLQLLNGIRNEVEETLAARARASEPAIGGAAVTDPDAGKQEGTPVVSSPLLSHIYTWVVVNLDMMMWCTSNCLASPTCPFVTAILIKF